MSKIGDSKEFKLAQDMVTITSFYSNLKTDEAKTRISEIVQELDELISKIIKKE